MMVERTSYSSISTVGGNAICLMRVMTSMTALSDAQFQPFLINIFNADGRVGVIRFPG